MDDTACAAVLVLAFAGESSLRTGCRELVRLAGELEHAAGAVRAPYKGLAAAARLLSDADADADDARMEAVMSLEGTAISLKKAAAAVEDVLRHSAENLLRACKTRPPKPPSVLLTLAAKLGDVAAGVGLPRDTFERARQDLLRLRADEDAERSISHLGREGTALADAGMVRVLALACSADRLALACQHYRRVADAIPLVRHAAAEAERTRKQQRGPTDAATTRQEGTSHTGRWWCCLGGRRPGRRRDDIEDPLIDKTDPPMPSPSATGSIELGTHGQGDDKRSGMMGYGLFGSIGLIPYLGPDRVAKKVELLSDNNKLLLHICVCAWWTLVALGAPCSAYAQSLYERAYALFSSRLGILGMNVVFILFMYCVLDIDHKRALYWVLGIACISHVAFLIAACWRRHF